MRLKHSILVIYLVAANLCYSQVLEIEKLLVQAETLVFSNPEEAKTIAEHTFNIANNEPNRIKSLYLIGLSHYVTGNTDLSLKYLFDAKRHSESVGNYDYNEKINQLIIRILSFLNLDVENIRITQSSETAEAALIMQDKVADAELSLMNNQIDSAKMILKSFDSLEFDKLNGFKAALYNKLSGDILFKQKDFISSLNSYKKSIQSAEILGNAFLDLNLYERLGANYLVLDSLHQLKQTSEKIKELGLLTQKIELRAANEAHKQIVDGLNIHLEHKKNSFKKIIWFLLILTLSAIILKIVFYIRNRNKIRMYSRMLKFLEKQKPVEIIEDKIENTEKIIKKTVESEPVSEENEKPQTELKESEKQLLTALEKFESSNKFTNKDMSLSKLASQLNTNNKYLSEVINRYKGKNFNTYINELRINYITDKMRNEHSYLNYKVSYLAEECGYSSHSTFTTVFKSIVGVSPIVFVDFIKKGISEESVKEQ